jgi:hypothetical protein
MFCGNLYKKARCAVSRGPVKVDESVHLLLPVHGMELGSVVPSQGELAFCGERKVCIKGKNYGNIYL